MYELKSDRHQALLEETKQDHWVTLLREKAVLPRKYEWRSHATLAILFAVVCSGAASSLYVTGSEDSGLEAEIGSVASNGAQNLKFGVTAYYVLKILYAGLGMGCMFPFFLLLFALAAPLPNTATNYISETKKERSQARKLATTIATYIGNFPLNLVGLYAGINAIREYCKNDQKKRQDVLNEYLQFLQDDEPGYDEKVKQPISTSLCLQRLGILLGILMTEFLIVSQTGYFCSSAVFGEEFGQNYLNNIQAGIFLMLLANIPTLFLIAISALELCQAIIDRMVSLYSSKLLWVNKKREIYYAFLTIFSMGIMSYFSENSSATAVKTYHDNCPEFDNLWHEFLSYAVIKFTVDQGTQLINGIWSCLATIAFVNYFKIAYASAEDKKYYQIESDFNFIKSGAMKDVNEVYDRIHRDKNPSVFFLQSGSVAEESSSRDINLDCLSKVATPV